MLCCMLNVHLFFECQARFSPHSRWSTVSSASVCTSQRTGGGGVIHTKVLYLGKCSLVAWCGCPDNSVASLLATY